MIYFAICEEANLMLTIKQLNKSFGNKQVLYDVNFTAQDGHILGLIGKNGSGKTTIFHSILKFVEYSGDISIDGHPFGAGDYNSVGYLPEERSLLPKFKIKQQIKFLARLKGMDDKEIDKLLADWMSRLEVKGKVDDKIKSLSKGNQQKVQMIATLIHNPQLIILDEPFSGLDPLNVEIMKREILNQKSKGATVIFSDHNMSNVEELCDDVVMIDNGKVVLNGNTYDVRNKFGLTRIYVRTSMAIEDLAKIEGVEKAELLNDGRIKLYLTSAEYGYTIFDILSQGKYIQTFDQEPPTLNEIFKQKSGEGL